MVDLYCWLICPFFVWEEIKEERGSVSLQISIGLGFLIAVAALVGFYGAPSGPRAIEIIDIVSREAVQPYHSSYVIETSRPDALSVLLDAALADAGELDCQPRIFVQGLDSFATSDGDSYCAITFDTGMWDEEDMAWWAPWTVRHEVAHLVTRTEPETHGPLFRIEEARLLNPLGIRLVYGSREYPDQVWLHDELVSEQTAYVPSPGQPADPLASVVTSTPQGEWWTVSVAQGLLGQSRTDLGFSEFWCTELTNHIFTLLEMPQYINEMASPAQLWHQFTNHPTEPQPGDLVFIQFQQQIIHVAVITEVLSDDIRVIEGNGSEATSEVVGHNTWTYADVFGFGRP